MPDYSKGMSKYQIIDNGELGDEISMEITMGEGHSNDSGSVYGAWDSYDGIKNPLFYKWLEEHGYDPKKYYIVWWSW